MHARRKRIRHDHCLSCRRWCGGFGQAVTMFCNAVASAIQVDGVSLDRPWQVLVSNNDRSCLVA